jgi:serine/threonine protein kinase
VDNGSYGFHLNTVKVFAWQFLVGLAELALPNINIIHADLKPDNIMIKEKDHKLIKVIDFGSAFFYAERKAKYIQTRFYRSPEVVLYLPYTSAIDMWSAGCILYELHTGKPLFNGKDAREQLVILCSQL